MTRITQIFLLLIFVFAVASCIPAPVPVGAPSPGYEQQGYSYGYDDQQGYGYDDEYVDVPITYGEPCYYAPPIIVTFAFDYFTYEVVGGYVDIVFWRGGHRYRHEPWYDHGRRISSDFIRANPNHRVRGPEFFKHRETLRKKHNISHPDNYYGLKPKQQIPRPGKDEQHRQWEREQPPQIDKRPQWEQRPYQQKEQKPQWGKQQPQQESLRQQPPQTKQVYQKEKQKCTQEKQKKVKERYKRPEQEQEQKQEQGQEQSTEI